jgi:hypothetical protein
VFVFLACYRTRSKVLSLALTFLSKAIPPKPRLRMSIQPVKYNVGRGMPASATLGLVGSSFAAEPVALFNFNNKRITNTISIENIPDHGELACTYPMERTDVLYIVNRRELAALFDKLAGRPC